MQTKSERLFEDFLADNNVHFEKIALVRGKAAYRPDYLLSIGNLQLIFELKELSEDINFGVVKDLANPHIRSHSRTVGDHVRRRIERSRKQIQYGVRQGFCSVLLIYNNVDPVFQMFGTEPMDFIAAMYGAYTIFLNRQTRAASEMFNGRGQMLQEQKNTSFSAVGHLCDRGRTTTVTLFENVFAKLKIPYDRLPPCFDVRRIDVSTEPLSFP